MTAAGGLPSGASLADRAFAACANACSSSPDRWAGSVRAAIDALFELLSSHPDQARACLADDSSGRDALARRDRMLDRFAELLRPGFAIAATPPPTVVADAITGGIYEIVRGHVLDGRLGELPAAVPDATVVALSPFVGMGDALAVAESVHGATSVP
jgi:hypothetical protein